MDDVTNRLVAVVFVTADLDRAVELYENGFGLALHVGDHGGDDRWTSGRHAAASWTDGEFMHFALYASKDGSATHGAQVSFRVGDLDAAHEQAVAAGSQAIHGPKDQPWGRSATLLRLRRQRHRAHAADLTTTPSCRRRQCCLAFSSSAQRLPSHATQPTWATRTTHHTIQIGLVTGQPRFVGRAPWAENLLRTWEPRQPPD